MMTESVSGVGTGRHFSTNEEDALRNDELTSAIVRRDTKVGVDIHGVDGSWRKVKDHQEGHFGFAGGLDVVHAIFEGSHLLHEVDCATKLSRAIGAGGVIAGAAAGLGLGTYEWLEAQAKGKDQNAALVREQAHVAVIGALDLPTAYKAQRLDVDFGSVPKGDQSVATKLTASLMADKPGLSTLQLHADRGMNAARDMTRSGMTAEGFLKANPKVTDAYMKDAAFHEGFDAYLSTKATQPQTDVREMERKLDERDGWYAQSQIGIRV